MVGERYRRPIEHIIPLELCSKEADNNDDPVERTISLPRDEARESVDDGDATSNQTTADDTSSRPTLGHDVTHDVTATSRGDSSTLSSSQQSRGELGLPLNDDVNHDVTDAAANHHTDSQPQGRSTQTTAAPTVPQHLQPRPR